MKKTYINPEMEIVRIATQQMMATSALFDSTPVDAANAEVREDDFNFE